MNVGLPSMEHHIFKSACTFIDSISKLVNSYNYQRALCMLQVDLVLGIEDYFWFLPWIRHHMNEKRLKIKPYKGHVKRFFSPLMGLLRGENYASAEHIANVLNPVKVTHHCISI